jgi:hypothetical protein
MTRRLPSGADDVGHPPTAQAQPFRVGQRPGSEFLANRQRPLLDPVKPLHHQGERDAFPQIVIIGDVEVEEILPFTVDRGDQHLGRHRHIRPNEERPFRGIEAPVPDNRAHRHHPRHHPIGRPTPGVVKRTHEAPQSHPRSHPSPSTTGNAPAVTESTLVDYIL